MLQGLQIPFDRVTYRDGQLLTAGDMQADQGRNSRMWDLHTRYLHGTWGVAIGFLVNANKGDSLVQVGPGYAVSSQGCPLVSSQTVPVPVPLIADTEYRVLVLNYQGNAAYRDRLNLDGVCLNSSTARQESPAFNWKAPADVQMGLDVPLVTVQVAGGAVLSLDTRVRRYVQKLLRPYIAAGATDPGYTQWGAVPHLNPILYQSKIDTSDAAFNNTPFYFAELHMWNQAPPQIYGVTNASPNTDFVDYGGPYVFLTDPSQTSFKFNLLMPTTASGGPLTDPSAQQWTVSWLGIEVDECVPETNPIVGMVMNFPQIFPMFPLLTL